MEKEKPIGEATAEQIKEWKETHKNVFAIKVDDADGRKHVCYLRAQKRKDLSAASVAGKADPLKFNEVILRQCWLGGDTDIRTDDSLFLAASGMIPDIVEVGEAELEKL